MRKLTDRRRYHCADCDDWKPARHCPDCGGVCAVYIRTAPTLRAARTALQQGGGDA